MRQFSVEGHDRAEGVSLRNQTQLSWCKVVIVTVTIHLLLFDSSEIVLEKILDGQPHDHSPDVLSVVKDARVFFLLLSAVEEASHQTDQDFLENPLEYSPEHPEVLILEVSCVLVARLKLEP